MSGLERLQHRLHFTADLPSQSWQASIYTRNYNKRVQDKMTDNPRVQTLRKSPEESPTSIFAIRQLCKSKAPVQERLCTKFPNAPVFPNPGVLQHSLPRPAGHRKATRQLCPSCAGMGFPVTWTPQGKGHLHLTLNQAAPQGTEEKPSGASIHLKGK